jgi:MFS family permease
MVRSHEADLPRNAEAPSLWPATIGRVANALDFLTWQRVLALGAAMFFAILTSRLIGTDAATYYAAGERLNTGHSLYVLSPGDRYVPLNPPYWTAPLLSPPLIAVLFRPLALLPIDLAVRLFVGLEVLGIAAVITSLVQDRRTALIAIAMSVSLGLAMVLGNVNGLLLVGYVVVWRFRDRPWIGAVVAVMGVVKIVPFVLIAFLATRRDRRTWAWFLAGLLGAISVSVLGAGWHAHLDYLGVLATSHAQPLSLPDLLGTPWISPAILLGGTIVAAFLPSAWSFRVGIATIVIGTPAVGVAIASQLFAIVTPAPSAMQEPVAVPESPVPGQPGELLPGVP